MYISHLSLTDFRSYKQVELPLESGVSVLVGPNGVGKTNLVEAIGYLAALGSHRVSQDAPLVRFGAEQAYIRARLNRGQQSLALEVEVNAQGSNRARINRGAQQRAREILGLCRTVLFAPEDLALIKGEPSNRRRFLDDLVVTLEPRHAGTRADYERVLKQRNALLKSTRGRRLSEAHEATLDVWDQHLAAKGAELLKARLELVARLQPHVDTAYAALTDGSKIAQIRYNSTLLRAAASEALDDSLTWGNASVNELQEGYLLALTEARKSEVDRGLTLVGPHREELELILGQAPAKGFASHGETWSFALALRLASYYTLLDDDLDGALSPILILDDVFAELDSARRARLAAIVSTAEQVLVTAAVADDIPASLNARKVWVTPGAVDVAANA